MEEFQPMSPFQLLRDDTLAPVFFEQPRDIVFLIC